MKAILILGAAVWADGPSPTLRRRTLHAATLWQAAPDSLVIPCGGLGRHPPTEAETMRGLLQSAGVAPSRILLEDRSRNTLENIRFALPTLRKYDVSAITIVTDRTHAPRARMVAGHFGLRARCDCPPLAQGRPSVIMRQFLRESGALPAYAWRLRRIPRDG